MTSNLYPNTVTKALQATAWIALMVPLVTAAFTGWDYVFDDAFISYRYARNLAFGEGIRWNVGEAPTEGYTNFLLVLLLAPFQKLGADPILVTRILSYLSVFFNCFLIWRFCKQRFPQDEFTPWISATPEG